MRLQAPTRPVRDNLARILSSPVTEIVTLVLLCSAYLQGSLTKIVDFGSALAEMDHFGLYPTWFFAVSVISTELVASFLVIFGIMRWAGALALSGFTLIATLIAVRFWEMDPGLPRTMATNAFFEHLGLAGAFAFVAIKDFGRRADR